MMSPVQVGVARKSLRARETAPGSSRMAHPIHTRDEDSMKSPPSIGRSGGGRSRLFMLNMGLGGPMHDSMVSSTPKSTLQFLLRIVFRFRCLLV